MKAVLICPSERPAVRWLAGPRPLAAMPLLGQGLIEYWLTHLACSGVKEVLVLADTQVEYIQALVGQGERWGLHVQVHPESRELNPAAALIQCAEGADSGLDPGRITVLDHFPGRPEHPLFTSYADWFAALLGWLPNAKTPDRVGVREIEPGIWVGLQSHISPDARLVAPCWVGRSVWVKAGAMVGPGAVVEDGALLDAGAEVSQSYVGPDTYVGRRTELTNSLALGSTLINWQTGSVTRIPDAFLLCALRRDSFAVRRRFQWVADLLFRDVADALMVWKNPSINKGGIE